MSILQAQISEAHSVGMPAWAEDLWRQTELRYARACRPLKGDEKSQMAKPFVMAM